MSIGVEKVNGGFIDGQWTEGSLTHVKVTIVGQADAFDGSFGLTPTEKGPRPAPNSAVEAVVAALAQFGTPVIARIVDRNVLDVALAYGAGDAALMQAAVREIGDAAVFKKFGGAVVQGTDDVLVDTVALDFEDATVVEGDYSVTV